MPRTGGFRTGDVVYDLQRTFGGKLFRRREHLERFMRSLKHVRLDPGLTMDDLEALTLEVVKRAASTAARSAIRCPALSPASSSPRGARRSESTSWTRR